MKKTQRITFFALILTLGSIISIGGNFLFKFIGIYYLDGEDYELFSLTMQTFQLFIPLTTLHLVNPLTREIRSNMENKKEIIETYAVSYWITSIIGFILLFIFFYFTIGSISKLNILWLGFNLVLFTFTGLFLGYTRSEGFATKSAIISGTAGITRAVLIIIFLFFNETLLTLDFFVFIFGMSYLLSFLMGSFLTKFSWKLFFFGLRKLKDKKYLAKIIKNFETAFLLSIQGFCNSIGSWLITLLAVKMMEPDTFILFDLAIMFVSFFTIFGANLSISIISKSKLKKAENKKNKNFLMLCIILTIISLVCFLILKITNFDIQILALMKIDITDTGIDLIRTAIFAIVPIIIMAYLNGHIQALGMYKQIAFSSIFGLLGLIVCIILAYIFSIEEFLIISLIMYYLLKSFFFNYYINRKEKNQE